MKRFLAGLALFATLTLAHGARAALAKFEPAQGCYIGAFIERDFALLDQTSNGKISEFEALTQKKHASYFTYIGYGRPFPMEWVRACKAMGAAPHIAFEPNEGLDKVQDDEYLHSWARDAARAGCPIFLRFASEMNGPWQWQHYFSGTERTRGNPAFFIEKFRLVSRIMKQEAPNVAMVWTPFARPTHNIPAYYPGDEWVDWVGVNIYAVYVHDGDPLRQANQEDPVDFLRYIYSTYAARKPIHISEFAATIQCRGTGAETVDFAIQKMTRFYTALERDFPRVKSVNWFCLNTIRSKLANNNYSFLEDGRALNTYRQLVADSHFLSRVTFDPKAFRQSVKGGTTLGTGGASGVDENLLADSGAVATTINQPFLRGLTPGQSVKGDLNLRAQLPLTLFPSGLIWQVDGRTVALTNAAPYKVSIPRERIGEGPHTARVIVLARDGKAAQYASPDVNFEIAPFAPAP